MFNMMCNTLRLHRLLLRAAIGCVNAVFVNCIVLTMQNLDAMFVHIVLHFLFTRCLLVIEPPTEVFQRMLFFLS